jgi:hypothetical protein
VKLRKAGIGTLPVQVREWAVNTAAAIDHLQRFGHPDLDRLSYLKGALATCNAVLEYIGEPPVPEPPPLPRLEGIEQYQVESR